ncbi:TraB/GumN family protein [Temperatibacter marinus]|uniref:TraB/GumN family protein n=1 Tax=Temperatibacter marinus TaxID=1456591 RepID=A0AA52EHF4_9PROT|nr:TraB/GumN family protein [Temperatibacter marinus]WND03718.1 TraB/GumN family protein [Temperatibacter marinus]
MSKLTNPLKKITFIYLFLLASCGLSLSATADVALYKIKDSDTTIYLMGTIHILPKGTNWQTNAIQEAFDASDSLVVEVSQSTMTPADMQPLIMKYGLLPNGATLESVLDADVYAMIKNLYGSNAQAWAQVNRMQPWLLGVTISAGQMVQSGFDPNSGVDKVLEGLAITAGKNVISLETAEYQMKALASMGNIIKSGMLKEMLEDLPAITTQINQMKDAWMQGDMDKLAVIMNEEMAEFPAAMETMLYTRNANWIGQIDQMMAKPGTVFIAVGAGHLAGEKSVIDLLKKAGIPVEQVQ